MTRPINPAERAYRLEEVDSVIVKTENSSELVRAKVVGFDQRRDHKSPIFSVVSEGQMKGRTLHWWHVSFT
ncbi:MAG: hypothetical protein V1885_00840 [Candidatus Brennerbacteria bacterium]